MDDYMLFADASGVRLGRDTHIDFDAHGDAVLTRPNTPFNAYIGRMSMITMGVDRDPVPLLPILRELARRQTSGDTDLLVTPDYHD